MPKVSVIVPNYNHALFLRQRLDSIFNQTFKDFEVIFLDDCSTDNSNEIFKIFSNHPQVSHYIQNSQNSGSPFMQWDRGINLAKGDYIWIAESDDWCELTFLEELMFGVLKDEQIVVSFCQSQIILEGLSIKYTSYQNKLYEIIDGKDFIKEMFLENKIFNASMAVFKRDSFYKIPNEYLNYRFCGDWMFWIELLFTGKVFISGKVLNYYRYHPKNTSNFYFKSGLNFIEELKLLVYYKKSNNLQLDQIRRGINKKFLKFLLNAKHIESSQKRKIKKIFFQEVLIKDRLTVYLKSYFLKLMIPIYNSMKKYFN